MKIKKSIIINNRLIVLEGFIKGGFERFNVAITNPLIGYSNLTLEKANYYYNNFIKLNTKHERNSNLPRSTS